MSWIWREATGGKSRFREGGADNKFNKRALHAMFGLAVRDWNRGFLVLINRDWLNYGFLVQRESLGKAMTGLLVLWRKNAA